MSKKNEFVIVFGAKVPKWKDCRCGRKNACKMGMYGYAPLCPVCLGKKLKEEAKLDKGKLINGVVGAMRGYQDIKAIGIDKVTGKQVGVNDKGEHVPMDKTRYDLRNDPHGWKVTGKKVRPFDSKGRPNT